MVESTLPGFNQCSLLTLLAIKKKKTLKETNKKTSQKHCKKKNKPKQNAKINKNIFKAP